MNLDGGDYKGGSTPWTILPRESAYKQEYVLRKVRTMFGTSQKLILNQNDEIFGISTIDWTQRTRKLAQYQKSRSRTIRINMELKLQFNP